MRLSITVDYLLNLIKIAIFASVKNSMSFYVMLYVILYKTETAGVHLQFYSDIINELMSVSAIVSI